MIDVNFSIKYVESNFDHFFPLVAVAFFAVFLTLFLAVLAFPYLAAGLASFLAAALFLNLLCAELVIGFFFEIFLGATLATFCIVFYSVDLEAGLLL